MRNKKPETRNKKHEIKKDNSYPVNPVHPVKKKMSDTTEIVTRFSEMGQNSAFRRVNAAVHTGERSRSDGWSQPFARVVAEGLPRSHGCTANRLFEARKMRKLLEYKSLENGGKEFWRRKIRGGPGLAGQCSCGEGHGRDRSLECFVGARPLIGILTNNLAIRIRGV
jgi:hypothetical protein